MDRPDRPPRASFYSGSGSGSAPGSAGSARPTSSRSSVGSWSVATGSMPYIYIIKSCACLAKHM